MAVCFVLTASFGHAQTLPAETDGNPNEVLVFEQTRVPRWLTETVVRAAQVTGVDPAYLMALADKESSLLPDNKARTSPQGGSAPASARRGPNASPSNRARPGA